MNAKEAFRSVCVGVLCASSSPVTLGNLNPLIPELHTEGTTGTCTCIFTG